MLTIKTNDELRVLITRPEKKAQALANALVPLNIYSVEQPLFDYQPLADAQTSKRLLTDVDFIVFVSIAAVEFSHAQYAAKNWRYKHIIAVGQATKNALLSLGIKQVLCPTQENSEGMLALAELNINPELDNDLSANTVTIVRGDDGRELLASQLRKYGATVNYLESYQLVWRSFPTDISEQWFKQQINCIVVTSNAILERLIQLTVAQANKNNNQLIAGYWRNQCTWIATSPRIGENAKKMGLAKVVVSDGANEQAVTTMLRQLNKPLSSVSI